MHQLLQKNASVRCLSVRPSNPPSCSSFMRTYRPRHSTLPPFPFAVAFVIVAQNPGFDFSGAEFNGEVPDARSFMGGVKYT